MVFVVDPLPDSMGRRSVPRVWLVRPYVGEPFGVDRAKSRHGDPDAGCRIQGLDPDADPDAGSRCATY